MVGWCNRKVMRLAGLPIVVTYSYKDSTPEVRATCARMESVTHHSERDQRAGAFQKLPELVAQPVFICRVPRSHRSNSFPGGSFPTRAPVLDGYPGESARASQELSSSLLGHLRQNSSTLEGPRPSRRRLEST